MKNRRMIMLLLVLALAFGLMAAGTVSVSAASKTPAKVKSVKVTAAKDTSISLSWAKAKDAKKYEVQYKKSSSKKWKSKKTKSKKITISGLKADTKYNFKVRGINGSKKGQFSKTVTQTTYKTPGVVDFMSIYAAKRSKFEITINWGKAKNATGYEVSIASVNRSFPLSVKNTTDTTFTTNSLKNGSGYAYTCGENSWYVFKIRSVNNKTGKFPALKGAWSKPYYTCTTAGDRVITGEKNGKGTISYKLSDTFVVGVDDGLIPCKVYPQYYYSDDGEINDVQYEFDELHCSSITFPANFTTEYQRYVFGAPDDSDMNGKTYHVGDTVSTYYGDKVIEDIFVYPENGGFGDSGYNEVCFDCEGENKLIVTW